tara:strand:- start:393 stop:605 length:213 start_codon:yes stop_codon:yes gene_type:complete
MLPKSTFKTLQTYNRTPVNYCGLECSLYSNKKTYNNIYNTYTNCQNNAGYGADVFKNKCGSQNFNTIQEK